MNTMKKNTSYNNGCKYILFRIGIYFREYSLAVQMNILIEILFLKKKDKKHQKKNLVVNLLELIQVIQKMVIIQIVRLGIQKHLLMSSKIKKIKEIKKILRRKKNQRETRNEKLKNKKSKNL